MKTNVFILIFCGVVSIHSVYAQDSESNNSEVMYDPTFWKQDLRLSKEQYFAISEINSEFYTNLIQVAQHTPSSNEPQPTALLSHRKDMIWELLSARQKSKWRKISKSFN